LETDGERFFLKWNDHPLPRQFEAEAAGLRALHASECSLVVPAPIAWHDDAEGGSFLLLEYLEPGQRRADFEELLGSGLAELHRCSTERGFGFDLDGYCGATPQPNGWMKSWAEFYGERRLRHQLELARRKGLAAADVDRAGRLVSRLGEWIHDDEPPALIHGDLWSGNLHVAPDGRPALIDPATYFAHREAELGMMALFGGFAPRVWEAYQEAFPLAKGWRSRLDLYELYHVLNHFNLFGGGYAQQAMGIVRQYVG
jgi:fructosamine-3-kinase